MREIPQPGNSFTSWQHNFVQNMTFFNYRKNFRQSLLDTGSTRIIIPSALSRLRFAMIDSRNYGMNHQISLAHFTQLDGALATPKK